MWAIRRSATIVLLAAMLAGIFGHIRNEVGERITSDSRLLYLVVEYNMLVGNHQSALKLLQWSSLQKRGREIANAAAPKDGGKSTGRCSEHNPEIMSLAF